MNRITLSLALALSVSTACKKTQDPAPGDKPAAAPTAPAAGAPAAPAPAPAAPAAAPAADKTSYKPDELWTKISGMDRMDMMDLDAKGGVTLTGTAAAIKDNGTDEYQVDFDAGGGHTVSTRFSDFGTAAKAKKLKAGDAITASKCSPTNPQGNSLVLVQCKL